MVIYIFRLLQLGRLICFVKANAMMNHTQHAKIRAWLKTAIAINPLVQMSDDGRVSANARWETPSPAFALKERNADPGVTNVRNAAFPHWRRWLGVAHRCVVPFTSFSENQTLADGTKPPVWFALSKERTLAFFAGIWTSVRKVKEGETTNDLFAFLTTEANAEVALVAPRPCPSS